MFLERNWEGNPCFELSSTVGVGWAVGEGGMGTDVAHGKRKKEPVNCILSRFIVFVNFLIPSVIAHL